MDVTEANDDAGIEVILPEDGHTAPSCPHGTNEPPTRVRKTLRLIVAVDFNVCAQVEQYLY